MWTRTSRLPRDENHKILLVRKVRGLTQRFLQAPIGLRLQAPYILMQFDFVQISDSNLYFISILVLLLHFCFMFSKSLFNFMVFHPFLFETCQK